jgi:hypothetical protein
MKEIKMSDQPNIGWDKYARTFLPPKVGSTAAVTGVIAATVFANTASILAGVLGVAGAAVAAASLYGKLTHRSDAPTIDQPSGLKDAGQ